MAEEYIETILIRQDHRPEVETPTFADTDVDGIYEFEGKIRLKQISKVVQNAIHNRHDYVFEIVSIDKIQKEV